LAALDWRVAEDRPRISPVRNSTAGNRTTWAILGAGLGLTLIAVLLVCALVLAYRNRQAEVASLNFWFTLTTLLAITSVTLLPGQPYTITSFFFPEFLMLVKYRRQFAEGGPVVRALQRIGAITFLWPWVAAFGLIAVRPWLTPEHFYSTVIFALPIRTAGAFPFAVLALLTVTMRHAD